MSVYLLAGIRRPLDSDLTLAVAARDVIALRAWHGSLRRWGLLESFALPRDPVSEPRACLVIRATGEEAAAQLAERWGRLSGYRVTVLALSTTTGRTGGLS
ncbi:MAG TPA: hypothetical protein VLM11_15380 [Streptosporangiaceae bacterium]|nr:hypothetical protein [Streptosporangiaceae bacterium]